MESILSRTSNRIELRIIHSATTSLDALMTVGSEGRAISLPVHTQLGMPLTVIVGDDNVLLRHGMLFVFDAGRASISPKPSKSTKKPTYGLIHYFSGIEIDAEAQVQFDVKLYVPTERYDTIWDLGAKGNLPREISLHVMGLQGDAQWEIDDVGSMLLVEDFSFSYPINTSHL